MMYKDLKEGDCFIVPYEAERWGRRIYVMQVSPKNTPGLFGVPIDGRPTAHWTEEEVEIIEPTFKDLPLYSKFTGLWGSDDLHLKVEDTVAYRYEVKAAYTVFPEEKVVPICEPSSPR